MDAEGINGLAFILTRFFKAETHLSIKCFGACAARVVQAEISALCPFLQDSLGLGGEGSGDMDWSRDISLQGCQLFFLLLSFFLKSLQSSLW